MGSDINDAGYKYLLELGLNPENDLHANVDRLKSVAGKEKAIALFSNEDDKDGTPNNSVAGQMEFYRKKNETLELSLAICGLYDVEYIRTICNLIDKNRKLFHGKILEIGCDCGIFSCFLGKMFPDAEVTAIDPVAESVRNARQLAGRLQVSNVIFRHTAIANLAGEFDVVFSSKVLMDTFQLNGNGFFCDPILETALDFCKLLEPYAGELQRHLKSGGTLFSIERIQKDTVALSWFFALRNRQIHIDESFFISTTEIKDKCYFLAVIGKKGRANSQKQLTDRYIDLLLKEGDLYHLPHVEFSEASAKLHAMRKELLFGTYGFDAKGVRCVKYAFWSSKLDPELVMLEQWVPSQDIYVLTDCERWQMDFYEDIVNDAIDNSAGRGITFKPFVWEDGKEKIAER